MFAFIKSLFVRTAPNQRDHYGHGFKKTMKLLRAGEPAVELEGKPDFNQGVRDAQSRFDRLGRVSHWMQF